MNKLIIIGAAALLAAVPSAGMAQGHHGGGHGGFGGRHGGFGGGHHGSTHVSISVGGYGYGAPYYPGYGYAAPYYENYYDPYYAGYGYGGPAYGYGYDRHYGRRSHQRRHHSRW